ncbi:hypothetical protein KC325_g204 [Hortaea werneckii]|nr:hypothetical protein KC325_g204 [Hortaea werneckii]
MAWGVDSSKPSKSDVVGASAVFKDLLARITVLEVFDQRLVESFTGRRLRNACVAGVGRKWNGLLLERSFSAFSSRLPVLLNFLDLLEAEPARERVARRELSSTLCPNDDNGRGRSWLVPKGTNSSRAHPSPAKHCPRQWSQRAIPRLVVRSDSELTKRYVGMLAELSDANECRDVWEFCDNRFRDKRWNIAESRFDLEPVDSAPLMEEEREEERTRGWRRMAIRSDCTWFADASNAFVTFEAYCTESRDHFQVQDDLVFCLFQQFHRHFKDWSGPFDAQRCDLAPSPDHPDRQVWRRFASSTKPAFSAPIAYRDCSSIKQLGWSSASKDSTQGVHIAIRNTIFQPSSLAPSSATPRPSDTLGSCTSSLVPYTPLSSALLSSSPAPIDDFLCCALGLTARTSHSRPPVPPLTPNSITLSSTKGIPSSFTFENEAMICSLRDSAQMLFSTCVEGGRGPFAHVADVEVDVVRVLPVPEPFDDRARVSGVFC